MNQSNTTSSVALVDDHTLFRKGIVELVNGFDNFKIIYEAEHGRQLQEIIDQGDVPEIILLDISMPIMDGFATAAWLRERYPDIKILILSMNDDEQTVIRMLKLGAKGYILKDADPIQLEEALNQLQKTGFYHTELISQALVNNIYNEAELQNQKKNFSDRELEFMKHASSELTYREIADKMCLSPRTIDGYRENLFEKLNVKSRVGLVLYAIKHKLVKVE